MISRNKAVVYIGLMLILVSFVHAQSEMIGFGNISSSVGNEAMDISGNDVDIIGVLTVAGNTVCDDSGNCGYGSGNISGDGNTNYIPVFTGTNAIGDSVIYENIKTC